MKLMSFSETIFLFFLALIIFGPKKLPEIARQVGKWMNEFRRASNEFKSQIEQEIAHLDVDSRQTILPPSPTPEGTASRTLHSSAPSTIDAPSSEAKEPEIKPEIREERIDQLKEHELKKEEHAPILTSIPVPADPPSANDAPDTVTSTSQESHA